MTRSTWPARRPLQSDLAALTILCRALVDEPGAPALLAECHSLLSVVRAGGSVSPRAVTQLEVQIGRLLVRAGLD